MFSCAHTKKFRSGGSGFVFGRIYYNYNYSCQRTPLYRSGRISLALATGVVVVPLGWLYTLSNFQLPTGKTNELLYGLMANTIPGYKNPTGASIYGTIAEDAWY
jgi:hypothetical protein